MGMVRWLDRMFYPDVEDSWDDRRFRDFVLKHLDKDCTLLDLGAGAGIVSEMNFRGRAAHVCGLDPDPRVLENPYLDEAKVGLGERIPWPDACFDVVIADNVLEHLSVPEAVFGEASRVLKPGGKFLFKTPNKTHYMPLIARMTPHGFHRYYNKLRGRASEDTFPTLYRANSRRDIAALAAKVSLHPAELKIIESRPEYLRVSAVTYLGGIAYERLVNSTDLLERFRILLMGSLEKRTSAEPGLAPKTKAAL